MEESTKYGLLLIVVNICFFCLYYFLFLFGLKRTNTGCVNNHVPKAIEESKDNKSKESIVIGNDFFSLKISGFNYISEDKKD